MKLSRLFPLLVSLLACALPACVASSDDGASEGSPDHDADSLATVAPITLGAASAQVVAPMHHGTVNGTPIVETSVADPTGKTAGSATFTFTVAQAGTYAIDLGVQAFKPNYNALFMQIDGGSSVAQTFTPTNNLESYPAGTHTFTAGTHTIVMRGKAQYTRLASILLTFKGAPARPNFSTHDGLIYDPSGKVFQPRGVDIDEVGIAQADIDAVTKTWSANIIRLSPYNAAGGVPVYDEVLLGQVVDAYTKRGVVVELGDGLRQRWGKTMQGQELADHAAYYARMAKQFKDNPYVWFASPNEQGSNNVTAGSAEEAIWLTEEKTIAAAIRGAGNQNILIQGDVNWGQGEASGGQSAFLRHTEEFRAFGNVVAGLHVYNNSPKADAMMTSAVNHLRAAGFAVVVDEVGDMNGPTMPSQAGADAVLHAVSSLGIGMVAFRWYESGADAFTTGGRGKGTMTPWGQKIWAMTHGD